MFQKKVNVTKSEEAPPGGGVRFLVVLWLFGGAIIVSAVSYNAFFHQEKRYLSGNSPGISLTAPVPDPKPAVSPPVVASSQEGLSPSPAPSLVRSVQSELKFMGFYKGEITGDLDQKTREALFAYRRHRNLLAVSSLDSLLEDMLFNHQLLTAASLQPPGEKSEEPAKFEKSPLPESKSGTESQQEGVRQKVLFVQSALLELGYGPFEKTGVLDSPTKKAISEFERDQDLKQTGELSNSLFEALQKTSGVTFFLKKTP